MSQDFEDEHVHHVYEKIAYHFSSTRYKVRTRARNCIEDRRSSNCLLVLTDLLSELASLGP